MHKLRLPHLVLLTAVLMPAPACAQQKFPERPIRLLIPFAAGGGTDIVARIVGQRLGETLGQPIVVDAKPGAGGAIAVAELMRAPPDGHTLMIATSTHAVLPIVSSQPWHPSNDFTAIAALYSYPFVLATNSENAARFGNLAQYLAAVRASPGKVNWGSSGVGGPQHLVGEQFNRLARLQMVHVPYKGNGPMTQALRANEVQVAFDTQTLLLPHIQEGRLRALAITSEKRSARLPDTPTFREAGFGAFSIEITNFILAPRGTPAAVQTELNRHFAAALEHKEVRDKLIGFGHSMPVAAENSGAGVKKHIDDFHAAYAGLVRELGLADK